MPDRAPCRVVVVDDQESYRRMLQLVLDLEADIELVGEAVDGVTAIEAAREHQPDVLLLDIAMPVLDGLEALPEILAASPRTAVVMLTGFGSPAMRSRASDAGARGFLEKGADPRQIIEAIHAVR